MTSDDLVIKQGETTTISWPIVDAAGEPMDLTSWTARGQIRLHIADEQVVYEWSAAQGNITTASSSITISIPAADSAGWNFSSAVYGIEAQSNNGQVVRVAQGRLILDMEVVR